MRTLILSTLIMLVACSSPPKPPVVDGYNRQGINSKETAEVIALRAQLAQTEAKLRQEQARPVVASVSSLPISQTFSANFPFNGTAFQLSAIESARLLPLLAKAHRVEIRGRTDGQRASAADEKVALNRALSAQRYLIKQGVSRDIISINYVSAGDFVADNLSSYGRLQNRRVEIEIFF